MRQARTRSRIHPWLFIVFNTMLFRPYCCFHEDDVFSQNGLFLLSKYSTAGVSLPEMLTMKYLHPFSAVYDTEKGNIVNFITGVS